MTLIGFTPGGLTVTVSRDAMDMKVWDLSVGSGRILQRVRYTGTDDITHASFSPDRRFLLLSVVLQEKVPTVRLLDLSLPEVPNLEAGAAVAVRDYLSQ